jgi:hypothetical protein
MNDSDTEQLSISSTPAPKTTIQNILSKEVETVMVNDSTNINKIKPNDI